MVNNWHECKSSVDSRLTEDLKSQQWVFTHRISQVVQWRKEDRTSQDFSYQESKRSTRREEIRQREKQENERATGNHTSSKRDADALMFCERDRQICGGTAVPLMKGTRVTCSLWPSAAECKGRASQSASWGRGAHLCDCEGQREGRDHIPPGQLAEDTPCSSLQRKGRRSERFCFWMVKTGKKCLMCTSSTFLSCFANYFNVLHGNFKKLSCDERCHIHLR